MSLAVLVSVEQDRLSYPFATHELLIPICFTKTFRVVQTIKQIPERYLGVLPPTAATATAAAAYFDDGEFLR